MTQEEKAHKYDEAIERAKSLIDFCSDSELKTLEYVFHELKESEDERIRKALIRAFKSLNTVKVWNGIERTDILAWLEKQGEHANFRNKIQIGDKVTRNEDGVFVNLSQLNRVAKKDKKQGEQNLIKHFCDCVHVGCHVNDFKRWCHSYQKEISYTDCNSNCNRYSKLMNHAFNIGETITDGISTFKIADIKDNYYIADDGERVEIYMAHRYYTTIQNLEAQKPAWSEEDKKMIRGLIVICDEWTTRHSFYPIENCEIEKLKNWLESLKDRVLPQPKQEWKQENTGDLTDFENAMMHIGGSFFGENAGLDPNDTNAIKEQANLLLELVPKQEWSEEDERIYKSITYSFANNYPLTVQQQEFVKSLKERYVWKPSDEQMDALRYVTNFDYGGYKATLVSLYEQLKKLRGE